MKILAVDDDPYIRELLPVVFREADYPYLTLADSGAAALELLERGCGQKLGLFSRHKAEAFTVLDWASATKGHLDACFVIPADVGINLVNKLGHGEGSPIAGIEELSLQTSKEAFTCGIVLRTRLS